MRIFNTQVHGLEESVIRSGYPKLIHINDYIVDEADNLFQEIALGEDSQHLIRAYKLGNAQANSGHDCFLKGIIVQCDIEAPSYWWPQFQRYHFADIVSSQSKMHRITKFNLVEQCTKDTDERVIKIAQEYIQKYNDGLVTIDTVLANIPQGLELTAGVTTNYLQLKTIYAQRKDHRLKMWREVFCPWVEQLIYAKKLGVVK